MGVAIHYTSLRKVWLVAHVVLAPQACQVKFEGVPRLFLVEERAWVHMHVERRNDPGGEAR